MRFLALLPLFFALGLCGVLPHTKFEKEIEKQIDVDEFKKDMKILDAHLAVETDAERAELQNLLAAVEPVPSLEAEAEKDEEAVNADNKADLFEGDIVLTNEQLSYVMANETERAKRQASMNTAIWGTTPIPFSFAAGVSDEVKGIVRAATAFWTANTCVNFQENGAGENKILVVNKGGCYSSVGKVGKTQELSLQNNGCNSISTATHELEHALGVYHEQSRADRDTYVRVNKDNIPTQNQHNFDSYPTSSAMGLPYDFGSNMHYTSDSFAKDYKIPTLIAVGSYADYQNSMRGHMPSFLDILKVNKYYKCDQKCSNKANPCKNGGYLDVRNCAKCVCPEGLGGPDCTGNPDGCVVELQASTSYTKRTIEMGKYGQPAQLKYENCAYVAPEGKRIEVVFDAIYSGYGSGCRMGGIELKTKTNMLQRGFRFCETPTKKSYWSDTNKLPMLVWSNEGSFRADIHLNKMVRAFRCKLFSFLTIHSIKCTFA
ncbi:hypothetical protein PRIPAC_95876, partial [Pristionchus pacificus]|uniref:Zinc metalloproteinase n=1 Tax=Pristionchus pacificus TaxID=54126 RepID=A0A2A6CU84_PRIPA